jgi:hypothetical protein
VSIVTAYQILSYGATNGYQGSRCQIQLMNELAVLGWVRFHEPSMPFAEDSQSGGVIVMNLPSEMFESVVGMLRNAKSLEFSFASGRAFLGSLVEQAGEGALAWPPTDLPLSRLPFPYESRPYNFFTTCKTDPMEWSASMQELTAYPPALMSSEGGYQCTVENPFQWGAVKGLADAIYGDHTMQNIGQILDLGLATPGQLTQRFTDLSAYLAQYGSTIKPAVYADLGTEIFGDPVTRTGFWNFYDHWKDYAAPTGPFDLGLRPPDPTTWLRKWYDPNATSVCQYPPAQWASKCSDFTPEELQNFAGLSFAYSPKKPLYGSHYRYSVCLNTEGWSFFWKQIIQWIAKVGFRVAFLDNTLFQNCWNDECQNGYRAWLATRFTQAEIDRLFTVTTSLLTDHSFELFWLQDANGVWQTPYSSATSGVLSPDLDSYGGLYSARLDGPGELWLQSYPAAPPGKARHYSLTIHYKTIGNITAELRVRQVEADNEAVIVALTPSAAWATHTESFQVPDVRIRVHFVVGGSGSLLVDELWLSEVVDQNGTEIIEPPTYKTELASGEDIWNFPGLVRFWATSAYWDSVIDDKVSYLRKQARLVDPEFQIFTNSYVPRRGSDYFMIERYALSSESIRQDAGFPPGLYLPGPPGDPPKTLGQDPNTGAPRPVTSEVLCTNIFDYKYTWSYRFSDFFSYVVHHPGSEPSYIHNVDSVMLLHTEAVAFGGGAGVDSQLLAYFPDAVARQPLREVGRQFFEFISQHQDLYDGLRSYAEAGIVFHDVGREILEPHPEQQQEIFDLAKGLGARGVLWGVLNEKTVTPMNISRFKVIIYHKVERISEAEALALRSFMHNGGMVIASGSKPGYIKNGNFFKFSVGMFDEFFRLRAANPNSAWPPFPLSGIKIQNLNFGQGLFMDVPDGSLDVAQVVGSIESHLAQVGQSRSLGVITNLPAPALERMRVAAWESHRKMVMHFVNYNVPLGKENAGQVQSLQNIEVTVKLPGRWRPSGVHLYTPEQTGFSGVVPLVTMGGGIVRFTIPLLHIYEVALLS